MFIRTVLLAASLSAGLALAAGSAPPIDDFAGLMERAVQRMHTDMHVAPTGDADRDFMRMMIPHHQGAVDMALVELRYGRDPRLRRLALAIVVEQKQEIDLMRHYLAAPSGGAR
jgi:uncharacterized protein (DUF305 family)